MKKVLLCVLTLLLSLCFFGCKDEPVVGQQGEQGPQGEKGEDGAAADVNLQGLDFYLQDDGTYAVGVGRAKLLSNIVIPETYNGKVVSAIIAQGFTSCPNLTSVTIPDSVMSIGDDAFYNCSSLTSVKIPDSVTSIGYEAFSGCSGLTSVYINSLASWCNISFLTPFSNPLCYAQNLYLSGELVTELVIPDSVTSIGSFAFENCSGLTSVVIPDSVTSIGDKAFENCSALTSVVIPDSVTSISSFAFYSCDSLTNVYYKGTAIEWHSISISSYNADLIFATHYYYSETEPTRSDNYWHYDENGEIAVW